MSARPLPAYLRLVPPPGKRFRPPRKPKPPTAPLHHDPGGTAIARMIRQAELVEEIMHSLSRVVRDENHWAIREVTGRLGIEVQCAAARARDLRDHPERAD